ncbi:MAG: pyridoxamine 5'-phosphate oxidase [Phycisphaerales bacterium]|nr:pyridoxamine 5'-phosphate oxidase [Phycisphaerales bacterium]
MDFDAPPIEPVGWLRAWLDDATRTDLPNPNAMTLATVDPDGRPSARIVLAKAVDDGGITFYTNRRSPKARAIEATPHATVVFHWDALTRQVVASGPVTRIDDAESDAYFASRPRASQIGAWASRQSEPLASRAALDEAFAEVERRYEGQPVPRPPHWGGYRLTLERIVFWQGHPFRLHDRLEYERAESGWRTQRLFP